MADLFNIQLETDLSEFDSIVTDGGNLSQSAAAALAGTAGGMSCLIDDTNIIYGRVNITLTTNDLRIRFYIDPNSLSMPSYSDLVLLDNRFSGSPYRIGWIRLGHTASSYRVGVNLVEDDGTATETWEVITDVPHRIEVYYERASSNVASDARVRMQVDGVLKVTISGKDLYDNWPPTNLRLGANNIASGISGTFYLDEFKANDDGGAIGPVSTGIAVFRRRMEAY